MKKSRLEHLKNNIHKLDIDLENGIVKNRATHLDKKGYVRLKLTNQSHHVHNIIAVAMGLDILDLTINHKNGNKQDNRPCNLEAITNEENIQHAVKNGLRDYVNRVVGKGETHYNYRPDIHDKKIHEQIKTEYASGNVKQKDLAQKYNMSISIISLIINNKMKVS